MQIKRKSYKVGTRKSRLAMIQTQMVVSAIQEKYSDLDIEIVGISTEGDDKITIPLSQMGGQGVFVKEIEKRLLANEIDFAVHSAKDMPSDLSANLIISSTLERANPQDCIVFKEAGTTLQTLKDGAIVGSDSLRRKAQLLSIRPDLKFISIRGNINTRINKLDEENIDAIVLAVAGLERFGWLRDNLHKTEFLDTEICMPAVGQGVIAIESRQDDIELNRLLRSFNHIDSYDCLMAERSFLRTLGASCTFPVGGYAKKINGKLLLTAMVAEADGKNDIKVSKWGEDPLELGVLVANELIRQGADIIINSCLKK